MMSRVDTGLLRQLYDHLGIQPVYVTPSLVAWQLQARSPEEKLPEAMTAAIDKLRDLAVMNGNHLQVGALEFSVGLDFLHGGRYKEALRYFETARRQWHFIDHLPLISLAHFGTGMSHHAARDYRQAAAAYFKVRQCLHQAETEPHRLEKIEAERSLQSFWNDLERWLILAINSLRRDISQEQDDLLRAELGEMPTETDDEKARQQDKQKYLATLALRMQPAESMSARDANAFIFETVDRIEKLDRALSPVGEGQSTPRLTISGINYSDMGQITIELADVATHTVAFCRWLMLTITDDAQPSGAFPESAAEPGSWFSWQLHSGHIAELMKTFVSSSTGKVLDEVEIDQLIRVIGHLAALHLNCQLTVDYA